jgi:FkbH-like protein
MSDPPLAIAATFTAEPIAEPLEFWIEELGWDYQVAFAPYNQVFQQLLDPESLLARNRDGLNVVLVRFEDWSRSGEAAALQEHVRRLCLSLRAAADAFPSPLLVAVCPASPGFLEAPDGPALARRMEALLASSLQGLSAVHLIAPAELAELYPAPHYYDPHADELGHIPYTPSFFAALATLLARRVHALRMTPCKAIVLDCDETLWRGVCAEDGPEGVSLDPPRRFLQEFMLAQREAGRLLCLSSKNNEQDVLDAFRANPQMPLQPSHFTARRINWEPKPASLISIANELNLGLASFLVVDDSPTECAELQARCPEVPALLLPGEPERIPAFLRHVWAFDRGPATPEDRNRAALYARELERGRLQKKTASLEEFLAALHLEIRIAPMTPVQAPRVAQLTARTNQMNFTCLRRSESEIQALLRDGRLECLTVDLSDRFGSYGLVGVMLFEAGAEALVLDTFLLSCRALGRGVEHGMLARLGEIAIQRGLAWVDAAFAPSARNSPALSLLETAGAHSVERRAPGLLFRFPAARLAALQYRPDSSRPSAAPPSPTATAPVSRKAPDYQRIATELATVDHILDQIAARQRRTAISAAPSAAPRTDLERQLAALWSELLGVAPVGIHDSFFDLGGHSLLAVQLLSRVRQAFDVDLSLAVVYDGPFTVAELAKAIDLAEIERAGPGYEALLEELAGLSDDQVRALLAAEQTADPPA